MRVCCAKAGQTQKQWVVRVLELAVGDLEGETAKAKDGIDLHAKPDVVRKGGVSVVSGGSAESRSAARVDSAVAVEKPTKARSEGESRGHDYVTCRLYGCLTCAAAGKGKSATKEKK